MPIGPAYGGGTGAGFRLHVRSDNAEEARFADPAARDAFFTANPSDLAILDNDEFILIFVTSSGEYQNRQNNTWVDVTSIITGPPGSASNLAGVSIGHVPVKSTDGVNFGDSGILVEPDGTVRVSNDLEVPSAVLSMGEVTELSQAGGCLALYDNVENEGHVVIDHRLDSTAATSPRPRIFEPTAAESNVVLQSDDTQQITTNPLSFNVTIGSNLQVNSIIFRTFAAMSNVRVRILDQTSGLTHRYLPNRHAWDNSTGGLEFRNGDNELNLFSKAASDPPNGIFNLGFAPLRLITGSNLTVEIRGDTVSILGLTGFPYLAIDMQPCQFTNLAYESDVGTMAGNSPWRREVENFGINDPSTLTPSSGDMFVVGTAPIGAFAGQANNFAMWDGASYSFTTSLAGWAVYDKTSGLHYRFNVTAWILLDRYVSAVSWIGRQITLGRIGGLSNIVSSMPLATNSVDGALSAFDKRQIAPWKARVLSKDVLDPSTLTPSSGDRHIVSDDGSAVGDWVGQENMFAEYNGSSWDFIAFEDGDIVFVRDQNRLYYLDQGRNTWLSVEIFEFNFSFNGSTDGTYLDIDGAPVSFTAGGGKSKRKGTIIGYSGSATGNLSKGFEIDFQVGATTTITQDSFVLNGSGLVTIDDKNVNFTESTLVKLYSLMTGASADNPDITLFYRAR